MLQLLDYRLYVKKDTYDQWIMMLQTHLKVNPNAAPPVQATATTTNCNNNASIHLSQIQQTRQALLRKAQQSLPSPPLEESYMSEASSSSPQKRKNSFSLEDQEDERISKRRC